MSETFPIITQQLFVELNGKIDFLVVVGVADGELLTDEQISDICERATGLSSYFDKNRVGVVIREKSALYYRDCTTSAKDSIWEPVANGQ